MHNAPPLALTPRLGNPFFRTTACFVISAVHTREMTFIIISSFTLFMHCFSEIVFHISKYPFIWEHMKIQVNDLIMKSEKVKSRAVEQL